MLFPICFTYFKYKAIGKNNRCLKFSSIFNILNSIGMDINNMSINIGYCIIFP